ncbi:MAG TPA: hypothetical protein VK927_00300 [Adhaeribacter sp.]|nr:hypothetical protein [Adhaeribacter sp.]
MKDQDMENQVGKSQQKQDSTGKGVGVSGQNPGHHEGPVAGSAANTRSEENPDQQNSSEKKQPSARDQSPQGSAAKPTSTRGADSSDKEFRNNQSDASTLQEHKGNADTKIENK